MSSGFAFMDLLVSEVTMIIGVVVFLLCLLLLILKRKTLQRGTKALLLFLIVLGTVYIVFILWAVIMWGEPPQPAAALY